eukprot:1047428-Amphidinium_carterae.1
MFSREMSDVLSGACGLNSKVSSVQTSVVNAPVYESLLVTLRILDPFCYTFFFIQGLLRWQYEDSPCGEHNASQTTPALRNPFSHTGSSRMLCHSDRDTRRSHVTRRIVVGSQHVKTVNVGTYDEYWTSLAKAELS